MKSFEMPENYVCKCREGRTYNKESEVCQKCVKSAKTLDTLFNKVMEEGSPKMIAMLMLSMLAANAEMEKGEKEEDKIDDWKQERKNPFEGLQEKKHL